MRFKQTLVKWEYHLIKSQKYVIPESLKIISIKDSSFQDTHFIWAIMTKFRDSLQSIHFDSKKVQIRDKKLKISFIGDSAPQILKKVIDESSSL